MKTAIAWTSSINFRVRSALDALGVELLTNHVECCVAGHGTHKEHARAKPMKPAELLAELRTALPRFLK
ncbi:hypothetical protein CfE428DRAFT_4251 [Chthoniobacter flavus Ellin428]|uniref:Uncharacterized protein n=1 Tax=Chthoniobacter flavus Ellin428 TaxID=497964 RepID=B4D5R2_9BACT|nr:hypothetical protein [Chthoniobacter flavus]EDY18115.1 hypothetical protein CfE428DRAFT_4251 [Chthoniobacter flavus Ellin428]